MHRNSRSLDQKLNHLEEPKLIQSQEQQMIISNILFLLTTSLIPTVKDNPVSCFLKGMILQRSGRHLLD